MKRRIEIMKRRIEIMKIRIEIMKIRNEERMHNIPSITAGVTKCVGFGNYK